MKYFAFLFISIDNRICLEINKYIIQKAILLQSYVFLSSEKKLQKKNSLLINYTV